MASLGEWRERLLFVTGTQLPSNDDSEDPISDPDLLAVLDMSREKGFLGPGPALFHVEHARDFLPLVSGAQSVLDLGSGGGVPGLVLARNCPTQRFVLLDAMDRRSAFLRSSVAVLGLADRVQVRTGRAEQLAREPDLEAVFDVVVARSFGPPAVTAECGARFTRPGGVLVVSEPPTDEGRWPADGLAELGLAKGDRLMGKSATLQILIRTGPLDDRFPRRVGIPAKRPLF